MPIISQADATTEVGYPGVERAVLVDATQGALSLYISRKSDLEVGSPPTSTPTAKRPWSSCLEAILGDQVVTLGEGDTVLAPAGVKHGFENRSGATARSIQAQPRGPAPGGSTLSGRKERKETVRSPGRKTILSDGDSHA